MDDNTSSLPQWAIEALKWVAVLLFTIVGGTYAWFSRRYILRIDSHAKTLASLDGKFATIILVKEVSDRLPQLVARSELIAHLSQMREDAEKRADQQREDRLRMHDENQKGICAVVEQIGAVRTDIRAVHSRVDNIILNK